MAQDDSGAVHAEAPMPTSVPRLVHRYWTGGPPPDYVGDFEAAWRRLHPAWDVHTWGDRELPSKVVAWLDGLESFVRPPDIPRHRANAVRYWLLWRHGGIWADCDLEPLRSLEPLLDGRVFTATLSGRLEGAVIGGPPRAAFFGDLVSGLSPPGRMGGSVEVSGMGYLDEVGSRHPGVRRCRPSMFFTHAASGRPLPGDHWAQHLWASSRQHVSQVDAPDEH
jgi:hypothetical protein